MTSDPRASTKHAVDENAVAWRRVEDQIVVIAIATNRHVRLSEKGSRLWLALVDGSSFAGLVQLLRDNYGLVEDRARVQAEAFLQLCASRGFLRPQSAAQTCRVSNERQAVDELTTDCDPGAAALRGVQRSRDVTFQAVLRDPPPASGDGDARTCE